MCRLMAVDLVSDLLVCQLVHDRSFGGSIGWWVGVTWFSLTRILICDG